MHNLHDLCDLVESRYTHMTSYPSDQLQKQGTLSRVTVVDSRVNDATSRSTCSTVYCQLSNNERLATATH